MNDPKPFASLSPSLLARKGAARPAMRPQLQPLHQFREATARQIEDDLGWNDMGHDAPDAPVQPAEAEAHEFAEHGPGQVVPITAATAPSGGEVPDVVRQQEAIVERVAPQAAVVRQDAPSAKRRPAAPRRSALGDGRRAAFTLRLDGERHLKLRLACTIDNRSAQQIVTEALDKFLDSLPDVATLASQLGKRR